jgi:hypothetical protein
MLNKFCYFLNHINFLGIEPIFGGLVKKQQNKNILWIALDVKWRQLCYASRTVSYT